jgi:hypothetical protein
LQSLALAAALVWATLPGFAQSAKLQLNNLDKLSDKAAEVNDVTLDGVMLELAGKFIDADHDPEAPQLKAILKDLKGIYVKNFEFDEPNQYSQADVDAIRVQLAAPGWSKIVESRSQRYREHDEIYVMKAGDAIAGMAILVAEPRELTVVNIVGNIDVDKLAALEGHLGVPGANGSHRRRHKPDDAKPSKDKSSQHEKEAEDDGN